MPTSDRAHVVADAYMYKRFSARGGKQPEMVARDHVAPRPTSAGMMAANEVHGAPQKPAAAGYKAFNFASQPPPPRPQSAIELKQALFKVVIEANLGPNRRHFHTYAKGSDSVASIKVKVSKAEGIPLPMFFRYKGNRLEDHRTMNDYPDIRDGCVVTMTRIEDDASSALPFRPMAMDEMDYLRGDGAADDRLPSGKWGAEQENRVDNPHLVANKHRPMGAYEMRMAELDRKMKAGPRMIGGAPSMPVAGAPTGFNSSAKGHMGANNPLLLARGRPRPMLLHSTTTSGTRIL